LLTRIETMRIAMKGMTLPWDPKLKGFRLQYREQEMTRARKRMTPGNVTIFLDRLEKAETCYQDLAKQARP